MDKKTLVYNLAVAKYAATLKDIAEHEDHIKEYKDKGNAPLIAEFERLTDLTDIRACREMLSGDISYLKNIDERDREYLSELKGELNDLNDQKEMLEIFIEYLKPEVMKV